MPMAWHPKWWLIQLVRRWEKRNKTDFYWVVAKVCFGSIQNGSIETFLFLGVLNHFWIKNCVWIFLVWLFDINVAKYLNQFRIKT